MKDLKMNLIGYADGTKDLIDIAEEIGVKAWELSDLVKKLQGHNILEEYFRQS